MRRDSASTLSETARPRRAVVARTSGPQLRVTSLSVALPPAVVATAAVLAVPPVPVAPPIVAPEAREADAMPERTVDIGPIVAPDAQALTPSLAPEAAKTLKTEHLPPAAPAVESERQPDRSMPAASNQVARVDADALLQKPPLPLPPALDGPPPFDVIGALLLKMPVRQASLPALNPPSP